TIAGVRRAACSPHHSAARSARRLHEADVVQDSSGRGHALDSITGENVQCGSGACWQAEDRKSGKRMHLVDTTLLYPPPSGGGERYLSAQDAWLGAHPPWQHSIAVPRPRTQVPP